MIFLELEDFQFKLQHIAHRQSLWRTHMWRMKLSISVKAEGIAVEYKWRGGELEGVSWCRMGRYVSWWCHLTPGANVLLASSFSWVLSYCSMIDEKLKIFHVHVCLKKWQKYSISEVHLALFQVHVQTHLQCAESCRGNHETSHFSFGQLWIHC